MSIQRWRDSGVMIADDEHGWWVTYDGHLAAVEAAYLAGYNGHAREQMLLAERYGVRDPAGKGES